jgi:hypothetical protein
MRMIRDSIPSKSMLVAGVVATLVSVALAGIAFATPPSGATAPVGNGARGLRASSPATADTVVEWNLNAARAIFVTAGQPPQQSVPHLAMVHGAVYDAVNAIDGGHEGYLISSRLATSSDSKEAAAATAAYRVLLNIVPAQQSVLDAQYAASLAAIPDSVSKTRGSRWARLPRRQ